MSEIIIGTEFNDPAIQAIRDQLSSKDDGVPFLLLPVKIETRFMKVARPVRDVDFFPDVLEEIFELEDRMHFDPSVLPVHEVLGKIRKFPIQLDEINKKMEGVRRLSGRDNDNLSTRFAQLEKSYGDLSLSLSKMKWANDERLRELRVLKNSVASKLHQTGVSIGQLKVADDASQPESVALLETLRSINEALAKISQEQVSVTDRKERKLVHSVIDDQFLIIDRALRIAKRDIKRNALITPDHAGTIAELGMATTPLIEKATLNIDKVKSAYKKTEYRQNLSQVATSLKVLYQGIDTHVGPRLAMLRELETTDARSIAWQINLIRFKLKRLNQHAFKTYDEIKNSWDSLNKKLDGLKTEVYKIIEGDEEEIKAVRRAWDDADIELEKFHNRVRSFKGVQNQKPQLSRTIVEINDFYRRDLSGLKSGSKSYLSPVNDQRLEKGVKVFRNAINVLNAVATEFEGYLKHPSVKKLDASIKRLVEFQRVFSRAATDLQVLPKKAIDDLGKISTRLEASIEKLIAKEEDATRAKKGETPATIAAKAFTSIKSAIESHAGNSERNALPGSETRSTVMFATRSVTTDELWVRFYPDDIAIHSHEEALTVEEVEAGKGYWQEIWAASDDYESKLAAWRAIATAHGSQRAAWIVKAMTPETVIAAPVREKLREFSKELVQANANLENVTRILSKGGGTNDLVIEIGQAFPTLLLVEEGIRKIRAAQVNLLLKTQRLLLKVKSHIGIVVKNIKGLSDVERSRLGRELDVVAQFVLTLQKIEKLFQEIKKVTSKELIKEHGRSVFPEVQTKESSWTTAPHSKVMPDKFVVITVRGGVYKHLVVGKPLPAEKLIVGLDPTTFESDTFQYDSEGNLIVDEKIKWLTDFNEAVNKGMAVTITLDEEDLAQGFDRVFVLGIKDTTPAEGKNLFERLIDNHHYIPEGASFLPVATPTNNTESGESGYRTFEEDAALSFAIERNDEEPITPSADPTFLTDGQRLANALGIDFDVLNNLDYHDRTEVSEAMLMNKALFHGTLGNYMEDGLDTLFTLDNVKHTKSFFTQFVTARGFLPSIRVGTQPYGILPTSAFSQFSVTADDTFIPQLNKEDFENPAAIQDELQTRYDIRLKQLL
ncbi:MAG TPA: hypothetical protein VFD46_12225, partial [Chryseolinea sp.]|nr:hypothetical protein [Chryseolinea sp.]